MSQDKKAARDVRIDGNKREIYRELTDEESKSPFAGEQMSKLFMFALGVGFDQGLRMSVEDSVGIFNKDVLKNDEKWIIKSVAVKEEEDPEILRDEDEMYQIAEEYANGGIDAIYEVVNGPDDTFSTLSTEVITQYQDKL